MLHLLAHSVPENSPHPYAEAVTRLASVRHALRLVEPFGCGPAPDLAIDDAIAASWENAGDERQKLFDRRSERLVGATAAGIEALLIEREEGREPHAAAGSALVEEIRRELEEVAGILFV
jgi:hypothetical protein